MHLRDILTPKQLDELQAPLSHYKSALGNKWATPYQLIDFLEKEGYKHLGSGYFANVYAKPGESFVLKLMRSDVKGDCYSSYIKALQRNQSPHLPRVGRIRIYNENLENEWHIIPLERLQTASLKDLLSRDDGRMVLAFAKLANPDHYHLRGIQVGGEAQNVYDTLSPKYPKLVEALNFIQNKFHGVCEIDIHEDNIMLRGNTIVITDPVSFRK